ncbi:MAG: hypothetical protein ACQESR_28640 [Planctomycetota bacterium]
MPSGPSGPDEASADTPADQEAERKELDSAPSASSEETKEGSSAPVAGRGRERRLRRQRHSRRDQRTRGSQRPKAVSAWLRGTGQFAFAAVLAGVLLAAIIAIKGRDAEVESEARWVDKQPSVDASEGEVDQRQWERSAEATETRASDLLLQTAAGRAAAKGERTADSRASTEPPNQGMDGGLVGHGDEQASMDSEPLDDDTAGMSPYPTTDVEPVAPARGERETQNTGHGKRGWRETPPSNPVRSVDRRSQPGFEQQR